MKIEWSSFRSLFKNESLDIYNDLFNTHFENNPLEVFGENSLEIFYKFEEWEGYPGIGSDIFNSFNYLGVFSFFVRSS